MGLSLFMLQYTTLILLHQVYRKKKDEKYKIQLHYPYEFLIEVDDERTEVPCHTKYANINLHDVYLITREIEAAPIEQPL